MTEAGPAPAFQPANNARKERRYTVADDTQACPHCAKQKNTPRSDEMQADLQKRLNRAVGQLNGIKQMINDNRYCGDVLIQLSATRSAIQSIERIVLQNHLETCVVEEIRAGNDEIVQEAMDLIRRVAK